MAYVRKVRTTSGAVAVQVARKQSSRVVILAHLGCHTGDHSCFDADVLLKPDDDE